MSRLLCCLCARTADMGAALSQVQDGDACDAVALGGAPPTMADVIRERKKKAGGAGLGTLRRRLAAAARRPGRESRPDRGCEHARFIRSVVSGWRVAEVVVVCEQLEAGAALRDLTTQADLAREPAPALHVDLLHAYRSRWWCDVELVGAGFSVLAHRALLSARCGYFRSLLALHPARAVPLEGAAADLSREELEAALLQLYTGKVRLCAHCAKWDHGSDGNLDIISGENAGTMGSVRSRSGRCGCARASTRRLPALLGYSTDTLHTDMRYLLHSGEYADARLVFRVEGGGAAYGFRAALELPAHRLVLAARSRFFRSVMSRRTSPGGADADAGGAVCVDEKVLPRRFCRALLHAAYTDQVDLSLIGRGSTSPSSTANSNSSSSWSGVRGSRPTSAAALEDAFQLYEIARFLEMAIVVQGCEDAIVEALSPETLPVVLRWAVAAHASRWVHRQAMRYLRDEFPSIMSCASAARIPRAALADALASPFLQASEAQALRALLRLQPQNREPTASWSSSGVGVSLGGRGARWRRGDAAPAPRHALADLVALVRTEHLPHSHDLLQQALRRGMLDSLPPEETNPADAWLGRGSYRPPRCFLPYLDELKALLETQQVPEGDVVCVRRSRLTHRIPDTLYMVAAARSSSADEDPSDGSSSVESVCVSPRVLARLRARTRELLAAPPAARALALPAIDTAAVYRQIALRCVRERSLPDGCAELLLHDMEQAAPTHYNVPAVAARESGVCVENSEDTASLAADGCWRRAGSVSRCPSAGSGRTVSDLHVSAESSRAGTCRRELPPRPEPAPPGWLPPAAGAPGATPRARLSLAVPDVAMAPNANTHLLTAIDYCRHPTHGTLPHEYSGGVLQLDLGDGATHTPRPGSRALRAAHSAERARREPAYAQAACSGVGPSRPRPDEDELRAALELSVMRAYSSLSTGASASAATLPHSYRPDLPAYIAALRSRASPSPSLVAGSHPDLAPAQLRDNGRAVLGAEGAGASGSPRRGRQHSYRHDYRLEPSYSGANSRGHSPNNYA